VLEENFDVPLHASLHRPLLVFGGERELTLMFLIIVATFVFAVFSWWALAAGVVLWSVGSWGLARAAAFDPQLSRTGVRALRFRKHYRARATPFAAFREWK